MTKSLTRNILFSIEDPTERFKAFKEGVPDLLKTSFRSHGSFGNPQVVIFVASSVTSEW